MEYYLGLGSNLGDRLRNLQTGLTLIGRDVQVQTVSPLYESEPVGPEGQPPYLNAVARIATEFSPYQLLDRLKRIEWLAGRRPSLRWGPRPLDMDILLADGLTLAGARLTVPHASLRERAFVLTPLADIAPAVVVPGTGETVAALATRAGDAGLARRAGSDWRRVTYLA